MQTSKKQRERAILNLVYSPKEYKHVLPSEEPDFKLEHKNTGVKFGVEITEFYYSESNARMRNISGYFQNIIHKKQYKHKDDILELEVKEVTIIPNDNKRSQQRAKGILRKLPNIEALVNKISRLVELKNKHFDKYIHGLNHVNLIINDCENIFTGLPEDMLHHWFFKDKLEKVLVDSKFREIFFITKLGPYDSSKPVCVPLKRLFLVGELFRFNFIMNKEYSKESPKDAIAGALLFMEFLKWRGLEDIYFRRGHNECEVAHGNTGLLIIDDDNKCTIIDRNDHMFSADFKLMPNNDKLSSFFDNQFEKVFNNFKSTYIFKSKLYFPIKNFI